MNLMPTLRSRSTYTGFVDIGVYKIYFPSTPLRQEILLLTSQSLYQGYHRTSHIFSYSRLSEIFRVTTVTPRPSLLNLNTQRECCKKPKSRIALNL